MRSLPLDSLHVEGFRAFQDLEIKSLGRVNLIVGKNNVGKSNLLDALHLYAGGDYYTMISEILSSRDERMRISLARRLNSNELLLPYKYLFHGRKEILPGNPAITIGPIGNPDKALHLSVQWFQTIRDDSGTSRIEQVNPKEINLVEDAYPRLVIQIGKKVIRLNLDPSRLREGAEIVQFPCVVAEANGLTIEQTGRLWDKIALTDLEEEVLGALRIIAPGLTGFNFIESFYESSPRRSDVVYRIPIVRIEGLDEPIPLRSLGQGMQRMLEVVLAMVNSRDGILLIDEIENGLHYSIIPQLWSLIFKTSIKMNIQVFATTHSWDCISAFQESSQDNQGHLIRLENRKGKIVATLFDEQELLVATRERIEVR